MMCCERVSRCAIVILGSIGLSGCTQQLINPWVDDYAGEPAVTTESAERVLDAQVQPVFRDRGWDHINVYTQDEGTTHWALWFQDPVEDMGSEDDQFAITFEDYFAAFYSPTRAIANIAAWPISAIVDPPGVIFCSDGRVSPQTLGVVFHDASRCQPGEYIGDPACPAY